MDQLFHFLRGCEANDSQETGIGIELVRLKVAQHLVPLEDEGDFRHIRLVNPGNKRRFPALLQRLQLFHERSCLVSDGLPNGALAGALQVGIDRQHRPGRESLRRNRQVSFGGLRRRLHRAARGDAQ